MVIKYFLTFKISGGNDGGGIRGQVVKRSQGSEGDGNGAGRTVAEIQHLNNVRRKGG
jgi:hypothetical protein